MNKYDDIINYSYNKNNSNRKKMSSYDRASQFAPFAALTGYSDMVKETARITSKKIYLDEEARFILDEKINYINMNIKNKPLISVRYFVSDKYKDGGSYNTYKGNVKYIDSVYGDIVFNDNTKIKIDDICYIEIL